MRARRTATRQALAAAEAAGSATLWLAESGAHGTDEPVWVTPLTDSTGTAWMVETAVLPRNDPDAALAEIARLAESPQDRVIANAMTCHARPMAARLSSTARLGRYRRMLSVREMRWAQDRASDYRKKDVVRDVSPCAEMTFDVVRRDATPVPSLALDAAVARAIDALAVPQDPSGLVADMARAADMMRLSGAVAPADTLRRQALACALADEVLHCRHAMLETIERFGDGDEERWRRQPKP